MLKKKKSQSVNICRRFNTTLRLLKTWHFGKKFQLMSQVALPVQSSPIQLTSIYFYVLLALTKLSI